VPGADYRGGENSNDPRAQISSNASPPGGDERVFDPCPTDEAMKVTDPESGLFLVDLVPRPRPRSPDRWDIAMWCRPLRSGCLLGP
jgi:hypothetical protein